MVPKILSENKRGKLVEFSHKKVKGVYWLRNGITVAKRLKEIIADKKTQTCAD